MATRYLVAMDHVDLHAKKVMRKYAQNRPLGDIERKYQYTLPQPMLSSYHVNTPTPKSYRPKSSAHVIEEEQQRLHDIYSRSRTASSAPVSRRARTGVIHSGSDHYYYQTPSINVSVQGRPATSLSEGPGKESRPGTSAFRRRPKTTGQLKKSRPPREFMVVKVDPEILMSSRRRKELTKQIREQWSAENHDVSSGQFVREQNASLSLSGPDTPTSSGQWLTFGGSSRVDSHGVVDAFATLKGEGQKYNIDGHSGSRVAQQLQKGGKIRIGRNGSALVAKETSREEDEHKSKDEASRKVVPLCWADQISSQEAKVVQARRIPTVTPKPKSLCETYPVVFKKLVPDEIQRPKLACKQEGSVASRTLPRTPCNAWLSQRSAGQESDADRSGTSSVRNLRVTPATSTCVASSANGEYSISMSPKESKLNDNSSSTERDQKHSGARSSERSKNCSEKKPSKFKAGSKTVFTEFGSGVKPLKVKPSPASLQVYTSPDPELSINVSGTKAELTSPRASSGNKKDLPSRDLPTGGKASLRVVSSGTSTGFQNPSVQTEFIHFATGLISPSVQRRAKSAGNANFAISKVREQNQREVSFDLSSSEETMVQDHTGTKDFDCRTDDTFKRTNTPVSPEPPTSTPPTFPEALEESETFAFSIPTANSYKSERKVNSVKGNKSPSSSEDKTSLGLETLSQATPDSQFDAITALMRESLAVPNSSDYSSQTDSSESHPGEDNCDESMTTNFHKHRHTVRFEDSTNSTEEGLPSRGQKPKVGDLLSSQFHPDAMDASVEVRRLRQQIRADLVKQQEDTEDDIHYLRLRQSKRLT